METRWMMPILDHPKYGIRPFTQHSMVIVVGGLVYICIGLMMIMTWTYDGPRASAISAGLMVAPLGFWGSLWMFIGVAVVASSRWPNNKEKWGYTALAGMAGVWAAVYLAGLLFDNNTLSETGGAFSWGLVAFLWWAVARLANPDRTVIIEVEVPANGSR